MIMIEILENNTISLVFLTILFEKTLNNTGFKPVSSLAAMYKSGNFRKLPYLKAYQTNLSARRDKLIKENRGYDTTV